MLGFRHLGLFIILMFASPIWGKDVTFKSVRQVVEGKEHRVKLVFSDSTLLVVGDSKEFQTESLIPYDRIIDILYDGTGDGPFQYIFTFIYYIYGSSELSAVFKLSEEYEQKRLRQTLGSIVKKPVYSGNKKIKLLKNLRQYTHKIVTTQTLEVLAMCMFTSGISDLRML